MNWTEDLQTVQLMVLEDIHHTILHKLNDDEFMISLAVAGFSYGRPFNRQRRRSCLKLKERAPKGDDEVNYLHRGIAGRTFVREFNLAEHVDVKSAKLENGMLNIHLHRDIPEEMKPKKIEINSGPTIEG